MPWPLNSLSCNVCHLQPVGPYPPQLFLSVIMCGHMTDRDVTTLAQSCRSLSRIAMHDVVWEKRCLDSNSIGPCGLTYRDRQLDGQWWMTQSTWFDMYRLCLKSQFNQRHSFWDCLPLGRNGPRVLNDGSNGMDADFFDGLPRDVTIAMEVRLPRNYEWAPLNTENLEDVAAAAKFTAKTFFGDENKTSYAQEYLKWVLRPIDGKGVVMVAARASTAAHPLVSFVLSVPISISLYGRSLSNTCVVGLLCTHSKLRGKRLSPVTLKELSRKAYSAGFRRAVGSSVIGIGPYLYAASVYSKSISSIFSGNSSSSYATLASSVHLRPLQTNHIPSACHLLNRYLERFDLRPEVTTEIFQHWLLPTCHLVFSFAVGSKKNDNDITDFISFQVITGGKFRLYYYACPTTPLLHVVLAAAIHLRDTLAVHTLSCLDIMDNQNIIQHLDFGWERYEYMYGYGVGDAAPLPPSRCALVL